MGPGPEYAPIKENEQVLLSLGITADHIAALPLIVKTGQPYILLEVKSQEILAGLHLVPEHQHFLQEQYALAGYCIFYRDKSRAADAHARIFLLDPSLPAAPGMEAASALACYLYDIAMVKKSEMTILQTASPDRSMPARISVQLHIRDGKILSLDTGSHVLMP